MIYLVEMYEEKLRCWLACWVCSVASKTTTLVVALWGYRPVTG